ncbi:uncharacterized protein LOC119171432 isoform X3 [Rhipicephalus microplus]|uniref:uncharacterized protein LOC119171432 isoform X3 n=1 Tax=Rhipicephalus microplus TaxID=6941 RepID=UPI003F6B10C1
MLAHCVGGNAFLWNAIFVGVVATASVCAPPATRPGGSSPLDEVINGMIPLFRLDNLNGAVLSGQPSSYSCFTATRSPISVHWEVNGSQAFDRKQFEIFYSPIDTIGPESMLVFARYSTLTIRQTVMRTCVALRQHNSPCILGYPCALPVDKCDGRCRCRRPFQQDASGCRMNTTLNSGCDQYRLCPEGAHCVNNVCACRPGYVPWGFGCLRRFLSGDGMHKVHAVIRFTLTAVFTVAMVFLGVWLYHHSHSPSLMRERSVANWEYMPKMDQT